MRVLAVTPLYPPHSLVGAWLATHRLLRHLVERDHEVTAFAYLASNAGGWDHEGVRVRTGKHGMTAGRNLARSTDLVISHVGDGGRGRSLAQLGGVPNVQLQHGAVSKVHSPDLAVFNAQWVRSAVRHDCPSIVVHPVVDVERFATTPGECVTIVNCSASKGIKTAWRVAERLPDRRFLGVLGGYDFQVTPRAVNFETIPTTPNMRDDVYARTRVLLMPSDKETWGMTGIEAMCSGIPVIAHPNPGLLESLGRAGIFVDRDDTDGWVEEIQRLSDPTEYAQAAETALKRVAELDPGGDLERFAVAVEALV